MAERGARTEGCSRRAAPEERGTDLPAPMLSALALAYGVSPLAIDMYLSAFPRMARDLHASTTGIQLTLITFMTGLAVGQLVIGPLSDHWGRRRPLLA
ncbi:MFS transporter [Streptomyces sp. NPDC013187]|uniref:MFS transporter n=1 Tax=Streptomyces sp. NPDC013187 TaxID=3364865 RepID=UPI00369F88D4